MGCLKKRCLSPFLSQRVGLHIPQDFVEIAFVLDRKTLEAALIDVASTQPGVVAMVLAHVAVTNPVHPLAELVGFVDLDDQVPVITHEAIAPELDFEAFCRDGKQLEKGGILLGAVKKDLAMIATIKDMKESPPESSP